MKNKLLISSRRHENREDKRWPSWWVGLEFKLEDLWVGVFWKRNSYETRHRPGLDSPALPAIAHSFDLYVCIIPCFPIHFNRSWR